LPYKIIHAHIKYPTSNNLTRPWNHAFVHPCLALSGEKDLRKRRETGRGGIPPGKAREYFHPGDPRPNSPLGRGVALNTTTRRGIFLLPSPRRPSPTLPPSHALLYRRRVAYLNGRERRDDRFASTYYVLWPAYARGEHWPPRSFLRGCTCCRELTLPPLRFSLHSPPRRSRVEYSLSVGESPLPSQPTALHRRRDAADHFCGLLTWRWRVWHSRNTEITRKISLRGTRVGRCRSGISDRARSEDSQPSQEFLVVRFSWWNDANFFYVTS